MPGFKRSFIMDDVYILLTVHMDSEYHHTFPGEEPGEKIGTHSLKAEDLLTLSTKVSVVLGEPGMGKTTMLHYLARQESKHSKGLLPIFAKLAEFSKTNQPLESFLLAMVTNYIPNTSMEKLAKDAIQKERALVLLDGLDEISRESYNSITEKIRDFISSHRDCRVIITSRKAGFQSYEVPYRIFEIDQLPFPEIETFVSLWFLHQTDLPERIQANPRILELARNPFLLSIICLIFEKDQSLPQRRVKLYQKSTVTLLTLYDEKQIPKVNLFIRQLKEQVLENAAYHFFCTEVDEFPYDSLIQQVSQTLTAMGRSENEENILQEIRENSGLLQKSDDNHLFVHRTFYEYYVSRKMREDTLEMVLSRAAKSRWEEPIRLYAAQIESITEGTQFIKALWEKDRALALRCYPDMDRVVEPECIKNLLNQADVKERVELVKGLPEKIAEPEKIVETLRELFRWETNGEVIYWGVQILEEQKEISGALEIVRRKLDNGAQERYQKYIANDMIRISGGEFLMGSPINEAEREAEETQHKVKVREFFISRYQVTNRLYEKFDPGHQKQRRVWSDQNEQPVIVINWYETVIFCRWLGCRLPTEAEWEYACRAGTTTPFYTGDNLTTKQSNYNGEHPYKNYPKGNCVRKTTQVGSYPPNGWGLYEMSGNIWEWCLDWYGSNFYDGCKEQGIVNNPQGPETGSYRVLRGGGWNDHARDCRSAGRYFSNPEHRSHGFGFRLVFVPKADDCSFEFTYEQKRAVGTE